MNKTYIHIIKKDGYDDLACGHCASVIYGYDEEICPVCGYFIDMSDKRYTVSSKPNNLQDLSMET